MAETIDYSSLVAGKFFSEAKAEDVRGHQNNINDASSEMKKNVPISVPGNYLCECASFAYVKDNKERCFPELFISDEKKSLNMTVVLRVIDGTDQTPKGASIFSNITLCPGGSHFDDEASRKVMSFTKPKLVALTGNTKIELTLEWIEEWLIPKFEKRGNAFVLVKDHKMKQNVMVMVDYDKLNKLSVKQIVKAGTNDKSITYAQVPPTTNMPDGGGTKQLNFGTLVPTNVGPEDAVHLPEVEDF